MAFGKRKRVSTGGDWKPVVKDIREVRLEKGYGKRTMGTDRARMASHAQDEDDGVSLLEGAMILGLVGAAVYVGYLALPRPLVHTPPREYAYNIMDIFGMLGGMKNFYAKTYQQAEAAITGKRPSGWFTQAELERLPRRYAVHIRDIVPPPRNASPVMRKLAQYCTKTTFPEVISLKDARQWFRPVTEYLSCIMKFRQRRLCDPAERRRLVSQLQAYSDMHQKLLGLGRFQQAWRSSPIGQINMTVQERMKKHMLSESERKELERHVRAMLKVPVTPNLPPQIVQGLRDLVRKGYITPYDFSWSGLSVPRPFAPAFTGWRPVAPPCGQATKA